MNRICSRILFCLIIIFPLTRQYAFAQKDYTAIDKFAKNAPPGISRLYKPLTHYLTDRYSSEDEKVRSISTWIMNNIKYDTKVFRTDNRKKLSPNKILRKRKAICQGYCDLFEAMCIEAGIDARTVAGYDKGGNYERGDIFVRDDHAWSAVNINGGWELIDLTWASGYIAPRKQTFRRLLYYFFRIPFTQKYRFVKDLNYNYFYTDPDTFAIDHLPKYPWWQLTTEKPIDVFEKDTTIRQRNENIEYAAPSGGAVPALDKDEAPVAYLKRAEAAFKFNSKNYRSFGEGKALYSYHWFRQTKKSKVMENKEKAKVYDSCKTIADEAKDAIKMYMKYTGKEREVRFIKNNRFTKESRMFSKTQKRNIADETRLDFTLISKIDRQIAMLKTENRNISSEQTFISGYKLPERPKRSTKKMSKADYENYFAKERNAIRVLKDSLKQKISENENENFSGIKKNEKHTDSLIGLSCSTIYDKIIQRVYFDWNHKMAVDTLQYRHWAISNEKDSIIRFQETGLKKIAENEQEQAAASLQIRNRYRQQLKYAYSLYGSLKDSLFYAFNIKDSCTQISEDWKTYNNYRMARNDEEIQRLKNKKRSLNSLNRYLRSERRYNNLEIFFEGKRYAYYNWRYSKFCRHEKKKAIDYYQNLIVLKKAIQLEETKCKQKIREEERREKEKNADLNKQAQKTK